MVQTLPVNQPNPKKREEHWSKDFK